MLELEMKIELTKDVIESPNLCGMLSDSDLAAIGAECKEGYDLDEQSRMDWLKRNEAGMNLALQIQTAKTFPWPDCANVNFPLVTIAAMQFHARAYPSIINGTNIVKCADYDESEQMTARARKVSKHMSWQLLEQDKCWEEQEDKAILNLSIVGTNFKKSYYSAAKHHNVSELVLAKDLVLNYWSKSVEECPRKTHIIPMDRNEIYSGVKQGIYRDVLEEEWYRSAQAPMPNMISAGEDKRQGTTPPRPDQTAPFTILEQHVSLDLDQDGYAEPYIVTFDKATAHVLRIVTRFNDEKAIERVAGGKYKNQILRIHPDEYFTKKTFIPSPDGGIYDIGFGVFLGPLNEATNSLVNMLLDCGTLQTTGGGFLGRGAKIRGGTYTVAPFEWKRVDSTGDDLRKSIFPLPVNAPSDVLFQLLSLLINYASRISGTTDITVGENPGQNTPASTTQTMVEMGQKIYTAIFKRIWRASKSEFQKLYLLNRHFLPVNKTFVGGATLLDYLGPSDAICPVADPNLTSESLRLQQAMALKTAAATTPGYNKDAVERRFLTALRVEGQAELFPGTEGQPPAKDPKLVIEEAKIAGAAAMQDKQLAADREQFLIGLQEEHVLNMAKVVELTAKAEEAAANAQNEAAYAQVALINAQISDVQEADKRLNTRIEHFLRLSELKLKHVLESKKLAIEEKKLSKEAA
jgi:chaperonin GroES